MLHDVAVSDPQIFLRRAKIETAAAALCWMVGRADGSVGDVGLQTQDLMRTFGLKSPPSTRAYTMRQAIGADRTEWPGSLGSARYLTGARGSRSLRAAIRRTSLSERQIWCRARKIS